MALSPRPRSSSSSRPWIRAATLILLAVAAADRLQSATGAEQGEREEVTVDVPAAVVVGAEQPRQGEAPVVGEDELGAAPELVLETCHGGLQRGIGARARRAREAGGHDEVLPRWLVASHSRIPVAPVPLGGIGVAVTGADLVL